MKIFKSLLAFGSILVGLVSLASCDPFGESDPEAGNQTYAAREVVATYDFEYSDTAEFSDLNLINNVCEVVKDDTLNSQVLHLSDGGGARIVNPFNRVKLQEGAAISFFVKLDSADLDRPLITFGSEDDDSAKFYFTPNGQVVYNKPGQLESLNLDENDPSSVTTDILSTQKWHFVALQVTTTGYQFYIDGKKSLSGSQTSTSTTSFQYETLVHFLNQAPYIYIGTSKMGDTHHPISFDDLTFIRNGMEESDWNKSVTGGGTAPSSSKVYINVGNSDCSSAFWTAFSDYFTIPSGSTFHTQFINYTSGSGNWNNWNLCVSTDADRSTTNYSEYFVLRSDLYGWGDSNFSTSNITSEGYPSDDDGWTQFRADMEGATVDMTVARSGATVTVTAIATCTNGTVYKEVYSQTCGDGNQNIRAFLVVDGSYLQLDPEQTYIGSKYDSGTYLVGNADYSSAWWTAFSDYYNFTGDFGTEDKPFVFHFINNQSGKGSNWNNWLLACTNGVERNGDGYSEHFILRSDAYGWGDTNYDDTQINFNGYDFSTNDYVSDMHGAECWVGLYRSGSTLNMETMQKKANGEFMPLYQFTYSGASGTIGLWLTAEAASLNVLDVAYYPYFKYIGQTE